MSKPVLYLFNGKVARFGNAVFGLTPAEVYTVTLDTVSHGSISASPMSGSAGTTITLSSTPDSGYELDYFTVNGVGIVGNTFTMPASNVTVSAVFKEIPATLLYYSVILDYTSVNTNGNKVATATSVSPTPIYSSDGAISNWTNPTGKEYEIRFDTDATTIVIKIGSSTDYNHFPILRLYKVTTAGNELLDEQQATSPWGGTFTFNTEST